MPLKFEVVNPRVRNPKMRAASHWIKSGRGGTIGYLASPDITRTGSWNVKVYGFHVSTAASFAAAQSEAESLFARM